MFLDKITAFSRDAATGALTIVDVETNGIGGVVNMIRPASIVVSGDGEHVYATG